MKSEEERLLRAIRALIAALLSHSYGRYAPGMVDNYEW